ncbi:MAG: Phosphate transport system permease protein PstA [Lentisphaerae bacterium ADurb.BinA184]|nr:MAG: Phosphate transport system permease protein PstA [Lentisphaerae bacterium ADurb.BinA184]
MKTPSSIRQFWRRGEPGVWASGAALAAMLLGIAGMLAVVAANGVVVFWPHRLCEFTLHDGSRVLGEVQQWQDVRGGGRRVQLKVGNRDLYGLDFRWIEGADVAGTRFPCDAVALERQEYGNFYGYLAGVSAADGGPGDGTGGGWAALEAAWRQARQQREALERLQRGINRNNLRMERTRLRLLRLRHRGVAEDDPRVAGLLDRQAALQREFSQLVAQSNAAAVECRRRTARFVDSHGSEEVLPVFGIVRAYRPNAMGRLAKARFYLGKVGELLFGQPREANTEGGLFPAIVGTVMMVFLMSVFSFPLGVLTAVYLREYARDGLVVRLVRIAVNNLAGVPSIVYGIFGLGFFVYGIGGRLDRWLFPERLPTPTLGTGGILWASLTLALLTVPVVIVASEEALGAIPRGIREGSLALGSTRLQTLTRLLLPMASPGIMTGFILAMARAAGEVAPLMITGVVKLAPSLPVDGTPPFVHVERKFMHLGFHIYDIGFQSPNVEAAKPMVFTTALLLVSLVLAMSGSAIWLRQRMKRRYAMGSF